MIYTLTLNPALDYAVRMEHAPVRGAVNRLRDEQIRIGGKGINVSRVLAVLGIGSTVWGFIAGLTGEAIAAGLRAEGLPADLIRLAEGSSRINLKLRDSDTDTAETEINGRGPAVPPDQWEALCQKLAVTTDGDTLVLSGSLPPSLPADAYAQLLDRVRRRKLRVVVDTAGEALLCTLPYRPFLIKPNREELGELFGVTVRTAEETIPHARQLQAMGARHVLVTLGSEGAVLLDEQGQIHRATAHRGVVRHTVGAGDATVAGFLAGCDRCPWGEVPDVAFALRLAMAAGGAASFAEGTMTRADVERLLS